MSDGSEFIDTDPFHLMDDDVDEDPDSDVFNGVVDHPHSLFNDVDAIESLHFFETQDLVDFEVQAIALNDYIQFDPATFEGEIIGDPEQAMEFWHRQEQWDTCAVAAQSFVLNDLLATEGFSESELVEIAMTNDWYIPGHGTASHDAGKLLEHFDLEVDHAHDVTFDELHELIDQGDRVIVGVRAELIWSSIDESWLDRPLNMIPGIPDRGANHAVQVIGIVTNEQGETSVVLNDPGHDAGRGMMIPREQFESAWETSDRMVISTSGEREAG